VAAVACAAGCDGEGPAVEANPQTIDFLPIAQPAVDQTSVVVSATASSGLPVRYGSLTPTVCSVNSGTGLVTGLKSGTCTVTADQAGNSHFAPAPQAIQDILFVLAQETLGFAQVPSLGLFDIGAILAVDSTGATVGYASATPLVCTVDETTGLVMALATGDCTVVASAGQQQIAQSIVVGPAAGVTVPNAPTGVGVSAGDTAKTAIVRIGGAVSGGAPITSYSVVSSPAGIAASRAGSPVVVDCPSSCAGFAFSVSASNALGQGLPSPFVDMVTSYNVVETFYEPDTQPNNSIFVGTFTLDATTGTVSNLQGRLSESMTGGATPYPGDTMTWVPLQHQLSSVAATIDGATGLLVTTFSLASTATLSSSASFGGTDGFSPGTGMGLYSGYPGPNPGNAYARIFVNLPQPTAAPTQAQIDRLAYADCTSGGMMGATCMTGTSFAGYGSMGSMSGYPISQTTTKQ